MLFFNLSSCVQPSEYSNFPPPHTEPSKMRCSAATMTSEIKKGTTMKLNFKPHLASLTALVFFMLLATGCTDTEKETQKIQAQDASFNISAIQLSQEYGKDAASADKKYKDKVMVVTGRIDSVDHNNSKGPVITLKGDGKLAKIQCSFSKSEKSSIEKLSGGDIISVKGLLQGKTDQIQVAYARIQADKKN